MKSYTSNTNNSTNKTSTTLFKSLPIPINSSKSENDRQSNNVRYEYGLNNSLIGPDSSPPSEFLTKIYKRLSTHYY